MRLHAQCAKELESKIRLNLLLHCSIIRDFNLSRTAVIIAFCFSVSSSAFSEEATLNVGNTPGYPGATVNVPVGVSFATNVIAAQFEIAYNTVKVSSGDARISSTAPRQYVKSREISPGLRRVVAYSLTRPFSTNRASFATIPFTVAPDERDSSGPITPSQALLSFKGKSNAVSVAGIPGTIFIRPIFKNSDGSILFFFASEADERYIIQASTNLIHWVNLTSKLATGDFMDLVDSDAPNYPRRFYRSVLADALGQITDIRPSNDGDNLEIKLHGLEGRQYTLQASTNFIHWVNLETVTISSSPTSFAIPVDQSIPARFFRLQSIAP